MVDHLAHQTLENGLNIEITASHFRQVLHTDCHQPSLFLLKSISYHQFSTKATTWGCEHEKDALIAYIKPSFLQCNILWFFCHPFHLQSPNVVGLGVV